MGNKTYQFNYKNNNSFEDRKNKFLELKQSNPDKIFVIIENNISNYGRDREGDEKFYTFTLDKTFTISQLVYLLRKRLGMDEIEALFLLDYREYILPLEATLEEVYEKQKDKDGFLYFSYAFNYMFG